MSNPSERERFSRVLVVEDNESQRRTITELLRKEGFDVVGCSTTAVATEHIKREDFGVVVLDLHLPDDPGSQFLARIRECNGRIRVIINTAFGSFDSAKLAVNLGAFAYVEKAGNPEELLRCVHAAARAHLDLYATDLEGVVAERTKELRDTNEDLKREIAERTRVEEALRESSERFRLLYERAPIGYQSLDERGHFIEVNKAWLDMLGYSREEVLGRWFGDFLTPEYVEHFKRNFPCFRAAGEIHQVRLEVIRKDGSRILVEYEGKIGYDEEGDFEKTHCVLQDITERQQAEEELRASEERFDLAVRGTSDGLWDWDLATGNVWWSPQYRELIGYNESELPATYASWESQLHPDDRERILDAVGQHLKEGRTYDIEYRLRTRSDGYRWFLGRGVAARDESGKPVRMAGSIQDITERKHVEQALRESEDRYRSLVENIDLGITLVNSDHEIVVTNAAMGKMFNKPVCEFVGKRCFAEFEKRDTVCEHCPGERAMSTGRAAEVETEGVRDDGSRFSVRIRAFPVRGEKGTLTGFIEVVEDVTERNRMEQALKRSEAFLNATGRMAKVGGWELDAETRELRWTEETYRIHEMPLNYRPSLDKAIDFFHPEDRPKLDRAVRRAIDHGEPYDMEILFITATGKRLWTQSICSPQVVNGKTIRLVGTFQDITERKQVQEEKDKLEIQLRQSLKMEAVGQLAGGVAHDFNNLLTVILGNTDILMSMLDRDPTETTAEGVKSGLEQIKHAGERAADMTNRLLTFSRKRMFRPEVLELRSVLLETEKVLRRLVREDIDFELTVDRDVGFIRADAGQIEQVILNLVLNAADAMPNGGKLSLRCGTSRLSGQNDLSEAHSAAESGAKTGKYVMITVEDNGVGMSPETMERVFEPFFTTKPVGKGTGLGLATVYGIVTQGGGHLSVESEPDRGSTFTVYLPAVESGIAPTEDRVVAARGGSEVVLLCEDEDMVREVTSCVLRDAGYEVLEAANGRLAMEVVAGREGPIHLLVTDVVMPEMNGRELAETMIADRPELCVVFVSGYAADVIDGRISESRQVDFIQKPFSAANLLRRIRRLLDSV